MIRRKSSEPKSKLRCSARYEGNLLSAQLDKSDVDDWDTKDRLIFLIHGYNVRTSSAHKTLKYFEKSVAERSRPCSRLANDIAWFVWPGDMYGFGMLGSAPFYSAVVKRTPAVGRLLGNFLTRRLEKNKDLKITLVAHSLGCRVALEALSYMHKNGGKNINVAVFLMAAAVPVKYLETGGVLREAVENAGASAIMYSNFDRALGIVFKLGQQMARGEAAGDAVGRIGEPRALFDSHCDTRWGHSEYWRRSAGALVRWMGYAARIEVPRHSVGKWRTETHRMPKHHGNQRL